MFPSAPVATTRQPFTSHDMMSSLTQGPQNSGDMGSFMGPMATNGVLGGAFGATF